MAGEFDFKDAKALYEAAREARINLCVFHGNADVPGEVSSLARMLWKHIPELAKRSGVAIQEDREGHPPMVNASDKGLVTAIARDMDGGRALVDWMPTASPLSRSMFAKGEGNSMNAFFNRFAQERGFTRDDVLSNESTPAGTPVVEAERIAGVPDREPVIARGTSPEPSRILKGVVPEGSARMSPAIAAQLASQVGR